MGTAIISHHECRKHKLLADHPEEPHRVDAINDRLIASGLEYSLSHFDAPKVTKEQLMRVHGEAYLDSLEDQLPEKGVVNVDSDTQLCVDTLVAARRAAGAAVKAVDLVLNDDYQAVFCNVRPPGHHAERNQAMGFCFYNNVAVAAQHAMDAMGLKRVAIVDFDVHHGNGAEDIFKDDPRVLFCSSFQHPLYPFSDPISDRDHIIKTPLAAGSGGKEFREAIERDWLPVLRAFEPELLLVSAGFDGHREDDMGELMLEDSDFTWVTEQLVKVADETGCRGIVSVLEGGYIPMRLARSATAHVKALARL